MHQIISCVIPMFPELKKKNGFKESCSHVMWYNNPCGQLYLAHNKVKSKKYCYWISLDGVIKNNPCMTVLSDQQPIAFLCSKLVSPVKNAKTKQRLQSSNAMDEH